VAGFEEPLVSALAEAAGDCLDQKGCQEAAKMVVMGMTVVYAELEKKRLKKLEVNYKSKYFSTRLSAMLFIQVIGSQSAATAFKLIQNNKCHVHSTAQQMAWK
jgi:hypothetical protein